MLGHFAKKGRVIWLFYCNFFPIKVRFALGVLLFRLGKVTVFKITSTSNNVFMSNIFFLQKIFNTGDVCSPRVL